MQVKGLWLTYRQLETCNKRRLKARQSKLAQDKTLPQQLQRSNASQSQQIYDETPIRPLKNHVQPA